jgi:trans-aconitate 2-methyltransferase
MWEPDQYSKFSRERSRPFRDLLAQVSIEQPEWIADLGCGTGTLTVSLAERWPSAHVVGIDSSPQMLGQVQRLAIPDRVEFVRTEISEWSPGRALNLIVSNAALHWIGDHEALFSLLAAMLVQGGTLAVQMPDRFHTPSQAAIEQAVSNPCWNTVLTGVGLRRESVQPLLWYVRLLHRLGFEVNAWETTYVHVLFGENPVLEWLKGTALQPLLERLDPTSAADFLIDVGSRLKAAYPPTDGVTLFPMPRLFFVATRDRPAKSNVSAGSLQDR